jgi:hypothetical protein
VDEPEARAELTAALLPLREITYANLVARFIGADSEWISVHDVSGREYDIQIQGFWDSRKHENIRVSACISESKSRRWRFVVRPLCDDFIKAADGAFVGE